jgi:hypothetical protein
MGFNDMSLVDVPLAPPDSGLLDLDLSEGRTVDSALHFRTQH